MSCRDAREHQVHSHVHTRGVVRSMSGMKLEGDYRFDASVQEVWDALFDPVILAAVMPGCEKLEQIDGEIRVG